MSRTRYLTPEEKTRELASFEDYKRIPDIWRRDHPEDHGGSGYIDHEVLPLVDALNAMEGVCTTQSCCGHRWPVPGDPDGAEAVMEGQLWIRLSEPMARAFDEHVAWLLAQPVINHVQKLYAHPTFGAVPRCGTGVHEVFDIQFEDGAVDEAQAVIVEFFEALSNLVDERQAVA